MTPRAGPHLCVIGSGTAGREALLHARALSPDVRLTLIAPERHFSYQSMAGGSLFGVGLTSTATVAGVAAEADATLVAERADVVHESDRQVLTREGDLIDYDYLLLAPGARSVRTLDQATLWEDDAGPAQLAALLTAVRMSGRERVTVIVPGGCRWPIPAYELALVLAWSTADTGARITILTAEERPLGALGPDATLAVGRELTAVGIELICGVEVTDAPGARRGVRLLLSQRDGGDDKEHHCERAISLAADRGPRIGGVPRDAHGFIEVDEHLRAWGCDRIWAAGECLPTELAHSSLAGRQADVAAAEIVATIAAEAAAPAGLHSDVRLTGILLTGRREQWLAENPPGASAPSAHCLWWPPSRAVGMTMAGQLAQWDAGVDPALPDRPDGLVILVPVAPHVGGGLHSMLHIAPSADTLATRGRDIEARQWAAAQRQSRAAGAELRVLAARLHDFTAHEQQVIDDLKRHGYLVAPATPAADGGQPVGSEVGR